MQDYQMFIIIGSNIAVLMIFMGISISLIIHMNKRIDECLKESYENEYKRKLAKLKEGKEV